MLERINLIIKTKNLSASQFADRVGVQRSSVSHVLSGRNKPSLEFIQKVLNKFPDIRSEWLLFGKGSMSNTSNLFSKVDIKSDQDIVPEPNLETDTANIPDVIPKIAKSPISKHKNVLPNKKHGKRIVKIVLLFEDNSFSEYTPE